MNKIEKFLTINPYSRPGNKLNSIKYIVIHWVGNANSSAIANRNYFESLKDKYRYASSHYIIGLNGEIIQCIPEDEVAYHAGNLTINYNSIGIENCHPDWNGKFNDNTYESLIELLVELCRKYQLSSENIIRHYDITEKICPKYYVENDEAFKQIKRDVEQYIGDIKIEGENNMGKIYKNGSTKETIYADTNLSKVIGSLSPYEQCQCLGKYNNRAVVYYPVGNTRNYKVGFAKWLGGIK